MEEAQALFLERKAVLGQSPRRRERSTVEHSRKGLA
jgi:hypothetical protein